MKINKYKFKDTNDEFLIYTLKDALEFPSDSINLELIEENVKLIENKFLSILKIEDLFERIIKHNRTRDLILAENQINSFNDLSTHYYLIKNKLSNLSKNVRNLVIEKYSEIINNYKDECISNSGYTL